MTPLNAAVFDVSDKRWVSIGLQRVTARLPWFLSAEDTLFST
jgi:hypothetical protein